MRKHINLLIIILLTLTPLALSVSWANNCKTVAVLPFTIHDADDASTVRQGILQILSSSISLTDNIKVVPKEDIIHVLKHMDGKDLSMADAYELGKQVNADYVVYGDVVGVEHSLSINCMLFDVAAYRHILTLSGFSHGMYEAIPDIYYFAQQIDNYLASLS
jgi:TolB-like protein